MKFIRDSCVKYEHNRNIKYGLFLCECGNTVEKRLDNVKYGVTKSCGKCKKKELKKLPEYINNIKVVKDLGMNNENRPKREAIFLCNCGNEFTAKVNAVKTNQKKSCGCLSDKPKTFTHRKCKHPLYRKWSGMITRTTNTKEYSYKSYGGRGIKVCDEWRIDFMSFYNWALANGYKEGLTIDRINVNGNYEPSNCQWITMKENTIKDRRSTFIEKNYSNEIINKYCNENITVTQLAKEYKTYKSVISRILKTNNIEIKTRRFNVSKN